MSTAYPYGNLPEGEWSDGHLVIFDSPSNLPVVPMREFAQVLQEALSRIGNRIESLRDAIRRLVDEMPPVAKTLHEIHMEHRSKSWIGEDVSRSLLDRRFIRDRARAIGRRPLPWVRPPACAGCGPIW